MTKEELVEQFKQELTVNIRDAIYATLANHPDVDSKVELVDSVTRLKNKRRRRRAPFLCLVPGCKNVGAPIYGMVCTGHKKTPGKLIKALRAARRKFHR